MDLPPCFCRRLVESRWASFRFLCPGSGSRYLHVDPKGLQNNGSTPLDIAHKAIMFTYFWSPDSVLGHMLHLAFSRKKEHRPDMLGLFQGTLPGCFLDPEIRKTYDQKPLQRDLHAIMFTFFWGPGVRYSKL